MPDAPQPPQPPSAWIHDALASIGAATIVTDADGRVLYMNAVAETMTGWPEGEAAGLPLANVFRIENETTRRPVTNPVAEVLASGTAIGLSNHIVMIARDGKEWILDDGAAPIQDVSGKIAGAVLVFRDVTVRRRAEQAVEEALAYAEVIVETVREPLVVLDSHLNVRSANRSYYRTFHTTAAATEGRSVFELGNRQWDIPELREQLVRILPEDSHFDDLEVDHDFDGLGRRSMILNARRLPATGRRTALILLAIEDATEWRRAGEKLAVSESRYRRLFETAQDGILLVDPTTRRIFDANPYLTDILGYPHGELVGKELWEIGLFRDIESNKVSFRTLQENGYIRYDNLPLRTRDGRRIDVEFVSNSYDVGDARVIQCNIRDVTDRKRAEDALRAAHMGLEIRVAERTAELAQSNGSLKGEIGRREVAEAEGRDLQQQLTTVQEDERRRIARELHDHLGQHLTAIGLGLKVAKDATPNPSPERDRLQGLQSMTDMIGKEIHHLAMELRPTALDDLGLQVALVNYADRWSERTGIEVDFHTSGLEADRLPPPVETALYRVVQEALANVFKHAAARRVSVVLQRLPEHVSAVVEDDGKGFEYESMARNRLGILGMRERVALVGGTLVVESADGDGTTVIARIPLPRFRRKGRPMPMNKLRVFLADDHAVVREGLKSLINAQTGMAVIGEAADGLVACEQVPALKPDVVVMDVSMPGLSGSQATARLKQECPNVRVLALTVHEDKGYIRQLLAAGAAGYVLKRAAPEELIHAIRAVASGGVYLDPTMAAKVVGGFVRKSSESGLPSGDLSERETEVAQRTAAGFSNKEIAAKLELSIKTVETYRARAMEKLGLRSRADLVRYAVQQGWLQDG